MAMSGESAILNELAAGTIADAEGMHPAGVDVALDLVNYLLRVGDLAISQEVEMSRQLRIAWLTEDILDGSQYLGAAHCRLKL